MLSIWNVDGVDVVAVAVSVVVVVSVMQFLSKCWLLILGEKHEIFYRILMAMICSTEGWSLLLLLLLRVSIIRFSIWIIHFGFSVFFHRSLLCNTIKNPVLMLLLLLFFHFFFKFKIRSVKNVAWCSFTRTQTRARPLSLSVFNSMCPNLINFCFCCFCLWLI